MKLSDLKCINESVNLDRYIKFREEVKSTMDNPSWLGDFSKEDLINMIKDGSKIWIYSLGDELVCSMMLIPSDNKSLTKFGLDLDYKYCIDYGPMFVNKKYIGNKLQYQMLLELDNYCANFGYKYAISTVHPDNIYSLNNLIKDNFIIINNREFKRGPRSICFKCFDKSIVQKILTFVVYNNKFLLLKGSNTDPQFHESFWYVVTGSMEDYDNSLVETVKRELKEETGLDTNDIKKIKLNFSYESLGQNCLEHAFVCYVNNSNVIMNEESIDYKWCNIDEFIDLIKWYYSKDELRQILTNL